MLPPMAYMLIELADPDIMASQDGFDPTRLSPAAITRLTGGALYARYQTERAVAVFACIKKNERSETLPLRLVSIEKALSNPALRANHRAELSVVQCLLSDHVPQAEKLDYVLSDFSRIPILLDWCPDHSLSYVRSMLGESRSLISGGGVVVHWVGRVTASYMMVALS